MRILLVDDDDKRRLKLKNHLAAAEVTSFENIAEADCVDIAKDFLKASYFDVLILDVVLPKRRHEKQSGANGLALLGQVTRSSIYKKPEKIIGVTAYLEDIHAYKNEFEKYCLTVIEANHTSYGWETRLSDSLTYTATSKLARAVAKGKTHVITVHGIRTFGAWQIRLKNLANARIGGIPFHSYKYGYFSIFAFFIPFLRQKEVKRLERHLLDQFQQSPTSEFVIFSHSFGTYLISHALKRMVAAGRKLPVKTLVLSGSVLRRDFYWGFITRAGGRVINDCADKDFVLWLSEMCILGTGMAGKCGFYGFQNESLINRYFPGGHSSYFEGDEFMQRNWLPLLDSENMIPDVDNRLPDPLHHELADKIVSALGFVKPYLYFVVAMVILAQLVLMLSR